MVDTIVKSLVVDYPVLMVAWARMGLICLILGVTGWWQIGPKVIASKAWPVHCGRGASAVFGTTMAFEGFRTMPLAECTALLMIAPVLTNLLSHWWLNEPGDRLSWLIALISFAGALLIARPGFGVFDHAAIFPLLSAFGIASFLTLTRAAAKRDDPRTVALCGPLIALLLFSLALPGHWVMPKREMDWLLFVAMGPLAALAQVLQAHAFRLGTTHRVVPIGYASLLVSIGLGWLIFRQAPDALSVAGMVIIAAAGIVLVLRR